MNIAQAIIERLALIPHPEGGWYRETWRAPAREGKRASSTAIHFLLESGHSSHWHKVDAAEFWLWHAGDPLRLSLAAGDSIPASHVILGPDVLSDHVPQKIVEPGMWQSAGPASGTAGYTLVSCVVAPGFAFSGFHLAPPGGAPGGEN